MVPIWEKSGDDQTQRLPPYITRVENHRPIQGYILMLDQRANITHNFRTASKNVSLSEIFASSQGLFPELFALTIESGHCQRPPQIKYFPSHSEKVLASHSPKRGFKIPTFLGPYLPKLPPVRVLILKGAWSIIRQSSELDVIMKAVPNLNEFHCSFHSFMPMAYTTMCNALRPNTLRRAIKHLSISLEGCYSRDPSALDKWKTVYPEHHLCRVLGSVAPYLKTLNYTGRLCGALFSEMMKSAESMYPEKSRLRSIDMLIQNTCRGPKETQDGVGVHNYRFIQAFEIAVFQAVRALKFFPDVGQVRIRFIDIDAPDPPIQPSFHLEGKKSWGFWSDRIYDELLKSRPDVEFDTGYAWSGGFHEGVPRRSHHLDFYRSIAENLLGVVA
ncbi:uncharacterized protein KY384_001831 [Bacidia gigantensis]|uniref:uncharacterized protein n=1 Tax=Bacidia gigantensis TaxID=2732470 RepID=UPI001D059475|nr:uncharacterized protein KY384_001831 [Bacidia gigantensis]KAG8533048.1 hypothetical protein KY384_001831 [Bacidia gigantensis]